jgi:hypothetical protein
MGICAAVTVNVGMGVAVCKTTGVMVGELDRVGESTIEFVGRGVCALSGWKEVDETRFPFIEVGVGSIKITGMNVRELDRAGVLTSGSVGRGVCVYSWMKEVGETSVPLIGVGVESSAYGVGGSRFLQAVRDRHMMINISYLKISMVLR